MAAFNKINAFVDNLADGVHNFASHAFVIFLCAVGAAPVATNSVLGDLTTISYTNLSSRAITTSSSSQTSGTWRWIATDVVLTAGGGPVAAFRYVGIYNDTPTSPADPLVGWYDYGSALTLNDTETLTADFDGTNGVLSLV